MNSDKFITNLPDFVVIGAMRAGTTTLYDMLLEVDDICLSTIKETDYFLNHIYNKTSYRWYKSLFKQKNKVYGEISPNYSKRDVFPGVAERLHKHSPNARIIYVVRDPIERIISHYKHSYFSGDELPDPESLLGHPVGEHILSSSKYAYQIKPYISLFGIDNILIIDFKNLITDKLNTVNKICRFLGVQEINSISNIENINSSKNISTLPNWFLNLNSNKIFKIARPIIPNRFIRLSKRILLILNKQKKINSPSFSADVISSIQEYLHDDMKAFSTISNIHFE